VLRKVGIEIMRCVMKVGIEIVLRHSYFMHGYVCMRGNIMNHINFTTRMQVAN